jgi:hypothetical protein
MKMHGPSYKITLLYFTFLYSTHICARSTLFLLPTLSVSHAAYLKQRTQNVDATFGELFLQPVSILTLTL